ncbi:MAG: hypothetical protein HC848_02310 [Limnobacter sp.]|nr:hypothetical protein [Limnobacter sp.]
MIDAKWPTLAMLASRRWVLVLAVLVALNVLVLVVAWVRGGKVLGDAPAQVFAGGLRADMVAVQRPWLAAPGAIGGQKAKVDSAVLKAGKQKLTKVMQTGRPR